MAVTWWVGHVVSMLAASIVQSTNAAVLDTRDLQTPTVSGWDLQGCYSDSVGSRALQGSYKAGGSTTIDSCTAFCKAGGFSYAGLEYSSECFCGDQLLGSTKQADAQCNMPCGGDNSQACGGPSRLTLYKAKAAGRGPAPAISGFKYLGCYTDSVAARTLDHGIGVPGGNSALTPALCMTACADAGSQYQYAGVEYSGECFCGTTILNGGHLVDDGCDMPCNGDQSVYCGGANRLNLYAVSSATPPSPSSATTSAASSASSTTGAKSWSYQGCYTDKVASRSLRNGVDVTGGYLNMTVENCQKECAKKGFTIAGLEYAQECFCDNSFTEGAKLANSEGCNMACKGNNAQMCGGPDRLSVYALSSTAPADYGPGTEFEINEPVNLGSPEPVILTAVSPPDLDMGSVEVLDPQQESKLWFNGADAGGDEEDGAVTVRLTVEYKFPSVVLENSAYLKDVSCTKLPSTIMGRYNNPLAFKRAKQSWISFPLIFVTTNPSCAEKGETFFLQSSSVDFYEGSMSFTIHGEQQKLEDIFENMDVDFGKIDYQTPSNSTSGTGATATTCGSPDTPEISGLPAVSCGSAFDKTLDDKLNYYSSDGSSMEQILALASPSQDSPSTPVPTLRKRWSLWGAIKKIAAPVINVVKAVAAPIIKVVAPIINVAAKVLGPIIKPLASVAIGLAKGLYNVAVFIVTGNYDQKLTLPMDLGPKASTLIDSPWGKAFKFYSWTPDKGGEKWKASKHILESIGNKLLGDPNPEPGLELYCVNCAIKGKLVAVGSLTATPLSGISRAQLTVDGYLYAGLFLGVNAFARYEKSKEFPLITQGLPGWSIPGIVALGPMLTLGIEGKIGVEAEGQLLVGSAYTWNNIHAKLDFLSYRNSQLSGFAPQIDSRFEAQGKLDAYASLGLPVKLEFGIDILKGKFHKAVALVDTPAIVANAELTLTYDGITNTHTIGTDECAGIAWNVKLQNEVELEVTDLATWPLYNWESDSLKKGCIPLAKEDPVTSSTTTQALVTTQALATTTITTTTATTTVSRTPTPNPKFTCPSSDGNYETSVSGEKYLISCSTSQIYPREGVNHYVTLNNLQNCVNRCDGLAICSGVVFDTDTKRCWVKSLKEYSVDSLRDQLPVGSNLHTANGAGRFKIEAASYYNIDITQNVRGWFQQGNRLFIDTRELGRIFLGDYGHPPWSFHMIYTDTNTGEKRIMGGNANNIEFIVWGNTMQRPDIQRKILDAPLSPSPCPGSCNGKYKIIDIAYGLYPIPSDIAPGTFSRIHNGIVNQGRFYIGNSEMGYDGYLGYTKTATIFIQRADMPDVIYPVINLEYQTIYSSSFGITSGRLRRDELESQGSGEGDPAKEQSSESQTTTSATTSPSTTSTSSQTPDVESTTTTNTTATADNSTLPDTDPVPFLITDTTGSVKLSPGLDGNLFISDAADSSDLLNLTTASFMGQAANGYIFGTSNDGLLHYFPSELTATGASRLRFATWDKLPKTSKLLTLVPFSSGDDTSSKILVAVDTNGGYAFLAVCGFKDALNKVFLVKDAQTEAGYIDVFKAKDMKFIVTGGEVDQCGPLSLVGAPASAAPAAAN